MRFAYADPPYLGMCARYGHEHGDGGCWNDVETHRALIERLGEFDGYALSTHVPGLRVLLPLVPDNARVMAWTKTFYQVLPNVRPTYAWEPVILINPRKRTGRNDRWSLDWMQSFVDRRLGFFGAKPPEFTAWILECLGVQEDDTFDDLFYGSGAVTKAYESWRNQRRMFT